LKSYNQWLHSDDEIKDRPKNRECVLLRFCEDNAKPVQLVVDSLNNYQNKNETKDEKRDRISRDEYNGKGWTAIAKRELESDGIKETKINVKSRADEIRKAVERLRKKKKKQA
jgi:hypothetical protein